MMISNVLQLMDTQLFMLGPIKYIYHVVIIHYAQNMFGQRLIILNIHLWLYAAGTHTHARTHTHIRTHTRTHPHARTHMHAHTHARTHTHTHARTHTPMRTHMHMHTHILCVCAFTYTHY